MSNIQAQIDALAVSIQVLDNTLSNVTGNTLSNYNQLSRIVAQQGNIYNTIYYGLGNMSTGNFTVNSNATVLGTSLFNGNVGVQRSNPAYALDVAGGANISSNAILNANANVIGNIGVFGNILGSANLILLNGNLGIRTLDPQYAIDVAGNANVSQNFLLGGNANVSGNIGVSGNIFASSNLLLSGYQTTSGNANVLGNIGVSGNIIGSSNLILLNGRMGLGITNPAYTLDVAGDANISSNTIMNANANVIGNIGVAGNIIGTSNLILLNGRIGLGITNPAYTLDVAGGANISSNAIMNANANVIGNIGVSGNILGSANLILLNGNLGILTSNPQYALDVAGNANVSQNFLLGGNANISGNIGISGNIVGSANLILFNGNIGIRTSDPRYAIDVAGNANVSYNFFLGGNANVSGNLGVSGNIIGTSNLIILGGNLGIRNSNPAYTVDVAGNINFTGNLYQNGIVFSGGGGGSSQWTTSGSNIYYNVANGNVGIGTSTPLYNLDIGGSANISSNVYCMNMFVINDCLVQGGDFSIMNGNLTVYKRFNTFGESVLNGNLTVYNADFYNYGNTYVYDGLYLNKNGGLYTGSDAAGLHAFYAFDTVNLMSTLYGGADDTNRVGYFQARGYGGGLPLLLNPNGGNVGIGTGTPTSTLSVSGNARITGNLFIGTVTNSYTEGTPLIINQTTYFDNSVNGTINGNVFPMVSYGGGREHIFAIDAVDGNISYFGITGGSTPDSDYFVTYKRGTGMKISNSTYDTNTFTETLKVVGDANVTGNMYSSTGYVPLCRASISFKYVSTTLTTIYSNNCSVARNSTGSYTITFTNGPGSTNYTVSTFSAGAAASTITQAWANSGQVSVVALKSSTQCLIWISDNNSDAANEPAGMCDVNFFW